MTIQILGEDLAGAVGAQIGVDDGGVGLLENGVNSKKRW